MILFCVLWKLLFCILSLMKKTSNRHDPGYGLFTSPKKTASIDPCIMWAFYINLVLAVADIQPRAHLMVLQNHGRQNWASKIDIYFIHFICIFLFVILFVCCFLLIFILFVIKYFVKTFILVLLFYVCSSGCTITHLHNHYCCCILKSKRQFNHSSIRFVLKNWIYIIHS